jgi:aldehyde dehydrogenase (NAD+)
VHDRGEFNGQLWISMDYVDGLDAAQLLAQRYPIGMPVDEVVRIVTAVASALDYAHKRGLMHRDVKPANIMLTHVDEDDEQRILLADFGVARELIDKIVANMREFRSAETDPSLRIVNQRQFDRLVTLISASDGKVVTGGGFESSTLRIEPTVIVDPSPTDAVMADEIFGPILPVLAVDSLDAAADFINSKPKPLALYLFTSSGTVARALIDRIPSGGAVVNHVAMHCMVPQLPFGGVGASGIGAYHGRWGFEAMSHRRAVLAKRARPDLKAMYPPYTENAIKVMRRMF